jgi:hypothetical protein
MRIDFTPRLFMDPQADLKAAKELAETVEVLKDSFKSLGVIIKQQVNDNIVDADTFTKAYAKSLKSDISQAFNTLGKKSEELLKNQESLTKGQAKEKDILKQITQNELKRKNIAIDLSNAVKNGILSFQEANQIAGELRQKFEEQNKELAKQAAHAAKTEAAMGNLGSIVKGLNKIPILGGLVNSEKVMEKMQETAAKTSSKTAVMATGFKEVGKSIKNGMLDPLTLVTFFLSQALKSNKQIVELGKQLGKDSYEYRQNLASAARFNSNINVTTENLVGAFNELAQASGYVYEYSVDQLETQIKLTKQVGLQADEAAQIQKFGILNNKTSEQTYNLFVKGLVAARNQLKVGINFKATLAEAAKVSGQLAANLGYNPERIAKAVVQAKAFGTTLEQTKAQGDALLDFESSLENELKAELLTGQQLNLERARAAALMGDQVALAEELSKQGMTLEKFSSMNVLAQKSYAQAVGLSADQLSDQLQKQQQAIASGKSLAQITEEEAKTALERQTVQDKFNQAVVKLQDFFGNLVAGPFGTFLDMLSSSLGLITSIGAGLATWYTTSKLIAGSQALITFYSKQKVLADTAGIGVGRQIITQLGTMLGISSAKAVAETAGSAAMTFGASIPIILGAAASIYGLIQSFKADDLMSEGGYGKRTLLAPEGAFKLNDNDTIIAGTDLSGGGGSMPSVDLTPMVAAINEVKAAIDRLYNKDTSINMDGKTVGSTLVQGSYKLA